MKTIINKKKNCWLNRDCILHIKTKCLLETRRLWLCTNEVRRRVEGRLGCSFWSVTDRDEEDIDRRFEACAAMPGWVVVVSEEEDIFWGMRFFGRRNRVHFFVWLVVVVVVFRRVVSRSEVRITLELLLLPLWSTTEKICLPVESSIGKEEEESEEEGNLLQQREGGLELLGFYFFLSGSHGPTFMLDGEACGWWVEGIHLRPHTISS